MLNTWFKNIYSQKFEYYDLGKNRKSSNLNLKIRLMPAKLLKGLVNCKTMEHLLKFLEIKSKT